MGLLNALVAQDENMRNRLGNLSQNLASRYRMEKVGSLAGDFLKNNDFTRESITKFVSDNNMDPQSAMMFLQQVKAYRDMGPQWGEMKINPMTGLPEQKNLVSGKIQQGRVATTTDTRTEDQKRYDRYKKLHPGYKGDILDFIQEYARRKRKSEKSIETKIEEDLKRIQAGVMQDPNRMTIDAASKRLSQIAAAIHNLKVNGGVSQQEMQIMQFTDPEKAKLIREGNIKDAVDAYTREQSLLMKKYFPESVIPAPNESSKKTTPEVGVIRLAPEGTRGAGRYWQYGQDGQWHEVAKPGSATPSKKQGNKKIVTPNGYTGGVSGELPKPISLPQTIDELEKMIPPREMNGIYKRDYPWERSKSIGEIAAKKIGQKTQAGQSPKIKRMGEGPAETAIRQKTGIEDLYKLKEIKEKIQYVYPDMTDSDIASAIKNERLFGGQ